MSSTVTVAAPRTSPRFAITLQLPGPLAKNRPFESIEPTDALFVLQTNVMLGICLPFWSYPVASNTMLSPINISFRSGLTSIFERTCGSITVIRASPHILPTQAFTVQVPAFVPAVNVPLDAMAPISGGSTDHFGFMPIFLPSES